MISGEVHALLRDYIDSFEALDVLLLLRRERTACTLEELCSRLGARAPLLDDALASLTRSGLVSASDKSVPTSYAYADEDPARDAIVASLERAYREEPTQIMKLMSTNAIERLRTSAILAFADAFVFRKGKGRG